MATLVAWYCRKAKQLESVQWYGMQRTHMNICKSKKWKSVAIATLVARYGQKANHLQSMQRFAMQRTQKRFLSSRNKKQC